MTDTSPLTARKRASDEDRSLTFAAPSRAPNVREGLYRGTQPPGQSTSALRKHLLYLLGGGGAHVDFDSAIAGWPAKLRGSKPKGLPHTAWQLLEHMRIAQWDILEFSRNPKHVSPEWPAGYWPETDAPPSSAAWHKSVSTFRADLKAMMRLVKSPRRDLFARIPHGEGQTILREALLVADHNAYHLGELVYLRRALGAWRRS